MVDELQDGEVLMYSYLLSMGDYRNIHQINTDHGVVHSPIHRIQVDRLHRNYTSTENNEFDFLNKKVEMFSNKKVDIKFSAHKTFLK
jgi:hypothetical protein